MNNANVFDERFEKNTLQPKGKRKDEKSMNTVKSLGENFEDCVLSMRENGVSVREIAKTLTKDYPSLSFDQLWQKVRYVVYQYGKKNRVVAKVKTVAADDVSCKNVTVTETSHKVVVNKDGSTTSDIVIEGIVGNSPKEILKAHGFDVDEFDLVSLSRSDYQQQKKGGSIVDLHASKITVKPKITATLGIKEAFEEAVSKSRKPVAVPYKFDKNVEAYDEIAVLSIADLHLGKLCTFDECHEKYTTEIAKKVFWYIIIEAISELEVKKKQKKLAKIIFFWSQDFFHFDTKTKTTTAGTVQDSDIIAKTLFREGYNMLIDAFKLLSNYAPVQSIYTASNHDEMTGYHAAVGLESYFSNNKNLTFDIVCDATPAPRKYIAWGVNLMGFGHGDAEGKRITNCMPLEAQDLWGASRYREFFLGHYHSEHTKDEGGVKYRYLGSPTGSDSWHTRSAFIGATKESQIFFRSKKLGPVGNREIPIPLSFYD